MSLYASGVIRIISDPKTHTFDSGAMVVNFGGGINEGKDKEGNYINNAIEVEAWNKAAELISTNCVKGDSIMVTGNIKRQDWEDKETGKTRSKHVLSVHRFEYLPRQQSNEAF